MANPEQGVPVNPITAIHVGSPTIAGKVPPVNLEYWTEELRRTATPIGLPKLQLDPKAPLLIPEPNGALQSTGHGVGSAGMPTSAPAPRGVMQGGQPVPSPLDYPHRVCGRLFFNQGTGSFSGSASLIAPNVLLTAGHCVHQNGVWSTNMVFYPSYGSRAATDPFYKIGCGRLGAKVSWVNNSDRAHDYGMAWMPSGPGNNIGWLGLLWNASNNNRTWEAVGYPATPNPPFDGSKMDHCSGGFAASSVSGVQGLNNDNMEHGSSGGPWITNWNDTIPAHANGLKSFHITDGDTTEYGPYFDGQIKDLFDWIQQPANH